MLRRTIRRWVPFELRLGVARARREVRDRRSHATFSRKRGAPATFRFEICSYERRFIDYPGQEHLGPAKRRNQALLAAAIHETLIAPGETFSIWKLAGRPTAARGYAAAAALKNRQLISETGGAVCLLSTVVYNVALLGAMEIVERRAHSVDSYGPRRYFELGRDAAIEFGYLDLRFRNPHAYPVLLTAEVTDEKVTVSLRSQRERDFAVELRVGEPVCAAPPMKVVIDPSLAPGEERVIDPGLPGLTVRTWRLTTYADGRTLDEDLGISVHHAVPGAVARGPRDG